jgi:hypothetical protein
VAFDHQRTETGKDTDRYCDEVDVAERNHVGVNDGLLQIRGEGPDDLWVVGESSALCQKRR